jgi:hypothetical protein
MRGAGLARKGVLSHHVRVLRADALFDESLQGGDPLIRLDTLRNTINRTIQNVDELLELRAPQ